MKYYIAGFYLWLVFLFLAFSVAVFAEPHNVIISWPDLTGATSYKIYGGNPGGPYTEFVGNSPLSFTIELENAVGEFYGVACNEAGCGPEGAHVINQCTVPLPGVFQIQVNMECN